MSQLKPSTEDIQVETLKEGQLYDFITGKPVKDNAAEHTLQVVAHSLVDEYGFELEQLERSYKIYYELVNEEGKTRKIRPRISIAVFANGSNHDEQDNITHACVVQTPKTKSSDRKKGVFQLEQVMGALPQCDYGLWTNGTDLVFKQKLTGDGRLQPEYVDLYDLPGESETVANLDIQETQGDRWEQIKSLDLLAWVTKHSGQLAEAEQLRRRTLDLCQQLDDRSQLVNCSANLAITLSRQGRFGESKEWAEKSLALCLEDGNRNAEGYVYLAIGFPLMYIGRYEEARQKFKRSLALVQEDQNIGVEATVHFAIGCLDLREGSYDKAQSAFKESLRLYQAIQGDAYIGLALSGLGFSTCFRGDLGLSHQYFVELLTAALRRRDFLYLMEALPGVALYLVHMGKVERAITVWAQAQCLPMIANSQWHQDVVGQVVADAVAFLPSEVVETAETRGREQDIWQMGESLLIELTTSDRTSARTA